MMGGGWRGSRVKPLIYLPRGQTPETARMSEAAWLLRVPSHATARGARSENPAKNDGPKALRRKERSTSPTGFRNQVFAERFRKAFVHLGGR